MVVCKQIHIYIYREREIKIHTIIYILYINIYKHTFMDMHVYTYYMECMDCLGWFPIVESSWSCDKCVSLFSALGMFDVQMGG